MEKSADAFRTISEVADELNLPQHVLRFWETRFSQIRPLKRAGGRRYYRPNDVVLLRRIRELLYESGYTIRGVQRLLKEQGTRSACEESAPRHFDDGDEAREHGPADADAAPVFMSNGTQATGWFPSNQPPAPAATGILSTETPHAEIGFVRALREALALVEECERILAAARGSGP